MPVDLLVLGAALLTGLLGGAHCVAMCGGIATGFSVHSRGWLAALQPNLGRMAGYVGVVNYLGARFTADQQAMEPVLRELASRGLLYLDDGSSPRSATELAAGRAPFLRADAVLDASLTSDAIDAALANLVSIAKARGFAIATATAFPLSVKEIADFASSAAGKGVVLVPVTALLDSHS